MRDEWARALWQVLQFVGWAALLYDTLTRWYDQCRDFGYYWQYYRGLPGFLHVLSKLALYTVAAVYLIVRAYLSLPLRVIQQRAIWYMQWLGWRSRRGLKRDLDNLIKRVEQDQKG